MNKYDVFSVPALIKHVQTVVPQLMDVKYKKSLSQTKLANTRAELAQIRNSLINRLSKMDRDDPKFFPKGSRVLYTPPAQAIAWDDFSTPVRQEPQKTGTVTEHDFHKVLVQFDGQAYFVRVEPRCLRLLFIRDEI